MAATNTEAVDLTIGAGQDRLRWWTPAEEPTVAYGFCSACGSSLFWRSHLKADHLAVAAGTLDPPTGLSTEAAIFTDDAGDYHRLDGDLSSHAHEGPYHVG